jgi:hypothetical protein
MTKPAREQEPGRRSLLAMLAAFAALTIVVVSISLVVGAFPKAHRSDPAVSEAPDPEVIDFLGPLASGGRFGAFRITRVDPIQRGQITLELTSDDGQRFVVDLHALSPAAPAGIAETSSLAIYLRTGRSGAVTSEAAQRACVALAKALREREESGHKPPHLDALAPPKPSPI